jgi:phosphate acetyltransferase
MDIMEKIFEKARKKPTRVVLPETEDIRTIQAAVEAYNEKIADVILIGDREELQAKYSDYDLSGITIINPATFERKEEYAQILYDLRKSKGMTIEQARELLLDYIYFATMMLKADDAEGMVAGAANSTARTLRPALQIVKTAKDSKMVSMIYLMCLKDESFGYKGTMIYGDVALNENPSAEELAYIAVGAAKTFENLTGEPSRTALLSYSTKGSAKSDLTEKVVQATQLAKEMAPDFEIDGELQFDAAVIPEIGEKKAPGSKVAGHANVLIFPDLQAGNITYKVTERMGGATAYPITLGLAKPVSDMSRGCSARDILGVVAITVVQTQGL